MEISEDKFFEMAATITAGIMANPANANLTLDMYNQQQTMHNVLNSLQHAMLQAGISVVDREAP